MAKQQKQWVYRPRKATPPKIPDRLKAEVTRKAQELIDTFLKPTYVSPPPENPQFNYITDISAKWWRSYFYFIAGYAVAGPNAIAPSFESKFARLTYTGGDQFTLSFMRYTEEWVDLYHDQSLDECLAAIKTESFFHP